jgi:hypothetical protein
MDAKVIAEVVAALSARTLTPEHSHMLKPWEMVFGGLVLPLLAELDESVKGSPKYGELIARYSKGNVEKFFKVREVERIVEKIVEKPVEKIVEKQVERIVEKFIKVGSERTPTLHETVEAGGKFRRLKTTVAKVSRKKIDLPSDALDSINMWWNANQKMADDGVCQMLSEVINKQSNATPLSAAQVAGWVSWLCNLALKDVTERDKYIASARKSGKFKVAPSFTPALIKVIDENKAEQAENRKIALAARKQMEAEVKSKLQALPTSQAAIQAAQAQVTV